MSEFEIMNYGKIADGYNGHTRSVVIIKIPSMRSLPVIRVYWSAGCYYTVPAGCSLPVFI